MKQAIIDIKDEERYVLEIQAYFKTIQFANEFEIRMKQTLGKKFSYARIVDSLLPTISATYKTEEEALLNKDRLVAFIQPEIDADKFVIVVLRIYNVTHTVLFS